MTEDSRSTVVVGTAPPLEDVLSGAYTERPFDLGSFYAYAKKNLFAENLAFLAEVDKLRCEPEPQEHKAQLLHIMAEYIAVDSPSELNLSDKTRKETHTRANAALAILDQELERTTEMPYGGCLDDAYNAVLSLLRHDQYGRYKDFIVVQRQLRVSRLDALWWTQEGLTLKTFFSFPSPVNSAESRLHSCLVTLLIPAASYLASIGMPWLWVFITYGFGARVACGPRLDPNAFLVLFVLRPLAADRLGLLENKFKPGSPKRFAQLIGLLFATACTALALYEHYLEMVVVAAVLLAASFLAGFCDICPACTVFMIAIHANVLPDSVCEDCKIRYIKGGGQGDSLRQLRQTPKNKDAPTSNTGAEVGGVGGSVGRSARFFSSGRGTESTKVDDDSRRE